MDQKQEWEKEKSVKYQPANKANRRVNGSKAHKRAFLLKDG